MKINWVLQSEIKSFKQEIRGRSNLTYPVNIIKQNQAKNNLDPCQNDWGSGSVPKCAGSLTLLLTPIHTVVFSQGNTATASQCWPHSWTPWCTRRNWRPSPLSSSRNISAMRYSTVPYLSTYRTVPYLPTYSRYRTVPTYSTIPG